MSNYYPGQAALIDLGPIEDAANNNTIYNPNVVNVTIQDPTGTERYTWSWPANPDITHVGTGLFRIAVPLDLEGRWTGEWTWDPGTDSPGAEPFTLDVDGIDANPVPTPTPTYCTLAQFRAATSTDGALSDEAAIELIIQAEDLIDSLLGGWWDNNTDRKVLQIDVLPWQWAKLSRATVLLTARLATNPQLLEQTYESVRGPDFAFTGPHGGPVASVFGQQVIAILDASGLRRVAGRAKQGRARRGRDSRFRTFWRDPS